MYIVGLLLAVVVGLTLGMIGSGGSILTVPILVYVFGINPALATTYSLLVIAVISFVGSMNGIKNKSVDFSKVLYFGLPSMVTVFVVRSYILPLVPDEITFAGYTFYQDKVFMLLFAAVMVFAAIPMFHPTKAENIHSPQQEHKKGVVLAQGVLVGFITGVVGAGGGFLIIPVLINSFKLTLKRAVSTSLVLITINSTIGLLGDLDKLPTLDWKLIIAYIILSVIGLFIGFKISSQIENAVLKKGFGIGIVLLSCFILIKELWLQ